MAKRTSGASSSKLTRSETVTVRLDPKLRYLAELAARKQRRTLSSYIEWAIEDSLKSVYLEDDNNHHASVNDESNKLWDVDEADRFCKLAENHPDLLTHDQQRLWKAIKELGTAIVGEKDEQTWGLMLDNQIIYPAVREIWEDLLAYLDGEISQEEILHVIKTNVKPFSHWIRKNPKTQIAPDYDEDIPF